MERNERVYSVLFFHLKDEKRKKRKEKADLKALQIPIAMR